MTVRYFDAKDFEISFAGLALKDLAPDFFTVAFDSPRFRMVKGIDGDAARVRNVTRSGKITITLMQSSPTNNRLSELLMVDELLGLGVLPFYAREKSGGTTILAPSCFIQSMPSVQFGTTPKDRVWNLVTDNLILYVGGLGPSKRFGSAIPPDGFGNDTPGPIVTRPIEDPRIDLPV